MFAFLIARVRLPPRADHGWQFGGCGGCKQIPQAHTATAASSPRACVRSYPTQVEKAVVWFWPWGGEPSAAHDASPQYMVEPVAADAATYTRDLPYGWDTLLENIADPSHIPFAHHGLQALHSLQSLHSLQPSHIPFAHRGLPASERGSAPAARDRGRCEAVMRPL